MINTEIKDSIAIVKMNHGKVNAIDTEFFEALQHELLTISDSPAKAVVLTGSGKAFSAGVDLFRLLNSGTDYIRSFMKVLCDGLETLFFFPKPVIAAVNGHALAGGCIMTCACDYRIGVNQGLTIGVTELLVGVPYPAIALEIMRFAAAPQYLQQIVYSGKPYTAEDAVRVGLLDETTTQDHLIAQAMTVASRFADLPQEAFAITKRRLREPLRSKLKMVPEEEQQVMDQWCSPETHETIRSYLNRTIGKKKD
jgi:enoyl-CoA hydratase